ncbi:MAG: PD40 domain-containing protein, partial [Planctomycetales bacterium]|nr:PD40 domain-containing protein [Planctomycetales bacterium]
VYEWPSGQLLKSIPQPKGLATATFSPDGTLLAIATWEHDVIVYDAASWAEEARMKSPSSVARLAFSPDGQWLAMASESAALWAFRVGTWDERRVFQGDLFRLQHLAFSPDGKTIVAGGGSFDNTRYGRVIGFDFEQASEIWTKNAGGQPILGIAFSPDGKSVAACGYEPLIQMFNARTGEPGQTIQLADSGGERILFTKDGSLHIACFDGSVRTFRDGESLRAFAAHEGAALELEMTDDGQTIFTGGADSLVHVWNAEDQRLKSTLKPHIEQADLPEPVHALAASLDGRWVATAHEDLSVRVRDAASGRLLTSVNGHDDLVVAVAFSPDGKWLATGSYDQSIKLWPIATEATQTVDNETEPAPRFGEPRELTGHTNWVFAIAFSPDGQQLASASYDKSVRLWDVETGKEIAKFDGHTAAARCVAFSPDGKRLVSGSSDRTAMVWDIDTHKAIATVTGHTGAVRGVSYSPDGQQFATGSEDNSIRIWDANSGQQLRELSGHENMVWCVAYSPRGATLVSGGFDRSVRLWNPLNGKLLQTMKSHDDVVTSVIYLPDSRALISAGYDKKLLRWNAKEPPIPPLAEIQVAEKDGARFAFVTPDQRRLVTGSTTRQVKFWDLATGQLIKSIDQQRGVSSGAISRDGRWLLTGGYGEQIYMWDITSMEQVAVIETGHEESTSVAFSPDGQ